MKLLDQINDFHDLENLNNNQLQQLANEIRELIIDLSTKKDIHLSSNLGIVELTISLLKVFNLDNDILLYDTGHQTYTHKILTGRKDQIYTIRDKLCGLMNMDESKYDHYSPGHSGNILSVISGMYQKDALLNKDKKKFKYFNQKNYVAVVGDSAFANGVNFEALNDIAYHNEPIIIILNDNGMSISQSVGSLSRVFNKLKSSKIFTSTEKTIRKIFDFNQIYYRIFNFYNLIQSKFTKDNIFTNLGYYYIGPINGHNFKELIKALERAKWFAMQGPVIVHVVTKKGKGNLKAENDKFGCMHSSQLKEVKSYGMYIAEHLLKMMSKYDDIYVINPAMTRASNCEIIQEQYPHRYFDVGISEEHALAKAGGMALKKLKPYVFIYSTFLQRAYDQLQHDISRLNLNVTLLIDRCDISGGDGPTHHGIYDIGFLKTVHNPLICMGRNLSQDLQLLDLSYKYQEGIFALRYPRGDFNNIYQNDYNVKFGEWELFEKNKTKTLIISYGPFVNQILEHIYNKQNVNVANAIFITKYDQKQLVKLLKKYQNIIIYERVFGDCLASDIFKLVNQLKTNNNLISMHYDKQVGFGKNDELDKLNNMDLNAINKKIKTFH